MMTDPSFAASVATMLVDHGGTWSGTAAELLALVPCAAADATRLAVRLSEAEGELAAAGVTVQRRRQAGTGRRLLVLRLDAASLRTSENRPPAGVTLGCGSLVAAARSKGGASLVATALNAGGGVTLGAAWDRTAQNCQEAPVDGLLAVYAADQAAGVTLPGQQLVAHYAQACAREGLGEFGGRKAEIGERDPLAAVYGAAMAAVLRNDHER